MFFALKILTSGKREKGKKGHVFIRTIRPYIPLSQKQRRACLVKPVVFWGGRENKYNMVFITEEMIRQLQKLMDDSSVSASLLTHVSIFKYVFF